MIRFLLLLFVLGTCLAPVFAVDRVVRSLAGAKQTHPPKPEAGGLRLEVNAHLSDDMSSDGDEWTWSGAFLSVEVALHNVSAGPITVATTAFEEKPRMMDGEPGLERFVFVITSPRFQGKPTAFVAARFTPVVLAPDEYVLIWKQGVSIQDRRRADELTEVSAAFVVSSAFDGPKEWWRGSLQTYAVIKRGTRADQFIAEQKAHETKYAAQKEAEKNPGYGKAHAARIAALIAGADEVHIRGEGAGKTDEIVVRDPEWIQRVGAAVAATSLPRSNACLCSGWRTAYFHLKGRLVVSVAAIHGNQLRIHSEESSGDYLVDEADWNAVKQALEVPAPASPPPVAR